MHSVPGHRSFWRSIARTVFLLYILPLANIAFSQPAAKPASPPKQPIANFVDIAEKAGLTASEIFGGLDSKKYIIETTGTGVAIFDYDNDGWPDIFIVNGTTLEAGKTGKAATNHLYHNNHDGTFTDVTKQGGSCRRDRLGTGRLRR